MTYTREYPPPPPPPAGGLFCRKKKRQAKRIQLAQQAFPFEFVEKVGKRKPLVKTRSIYHGPVPRKMVKFNPGLIEILSAVFLLRACNSSLQNTVEPLL